jgi:putative flippase GtrA
VGTEADQQTTTGRLLTGTIRLATRLGGDDARMQFVRFVGAGAVANVLYGVLLVVLAPVGDELANVVGALASSALANELHRRLTFRAGARVTWLRAQWEGGGLAIAGTLATSFVLARFDVVVPDAGAGAHLAVVAVVTGAVGLVRFAALRWVCAAGHRAAPAAAGGSGTSGGVPVAAAA